MDALYRLQSELQSAGLIVDHPILDGSVKRVGTTNKPKSKDGWYIGWIKNINGKDYICCSIGDWSRSNDAITTYKSWGDNDSLSFADSNMVLEYQQELRAKAQQEKIKRQQYAAENASLEWLELSTVGNSEYLNNKGVKGYDIKYGRDDKEGNFIAIPIRGHDGSTKGLQYIYDKPLSFDSTRNKTFTSGLEKKGNFHVVSTVNNKLLTEFPICFSEGYATAASIHEATGYPVVVTIDAGNIEPVVRSWREKYPDHDFVICADNDQWKPELGNIGLEKSTIAAKMYNCRLAIPTFSSVDTKPTDFNDLYLLDGADAVKSVVESAMFVVDAVMERHINDFDNINYDDCPALLNFEEMSITDDKPKSNFKFISCSNLLTREFKTNWLVKGLFEKQTMGLVFGNSASGKSLFVQDLAWCLSNGFDFKDKEIKQKSKVAYICGEGFSGLMRRFRALQCYYGGNGDNLLISEQPAAFMDMESAHSVSEAIKEWGGCDLIIIDTFHRNMGAGDENSAKDFAQFLGNIDNFIKPLDATIIIIHHSGHDNKERSRGSSAIRASMDFEYQVSKDEDAGLTTIKNTKMKDFDAPIPITLKFTPIDLHLEDEDGEKIMGVVLAQTEEKVLAPSKRLDVVSQNVLDALRDSIFEKGVSCPFDVKELFKSDLKNAPKKVIHIDDFRSIAYPFFNVERDSLRKTLKRTIEKLERLNKCMFYNGYLWVTACGTGRDGTGQT